MARQFHGRMVARPRWFHTCLRAKSRDTLSCDDHSFFCVNDLETHFTFKTYFFVTTVRVQRCSAETTIPVFHITALRKFVQYLKNFVKNSSQRGGWSNIFRFFYVKEIVQGFFSLEERALLKPLSGELCKKHYKCKN